MGSLIINAILKYIEANPAVVEELVQFAFSAVLSHLRTQKGAGA